MDVRERCLYPCTMGDNLLMIDNRIYMIGADVYTCKADERERDTGYGIRDTGYEDEDEDELRTRTAQLMQQYIQDESTLIKY